MTYRGRFIRIGNFEFLAFESTPFRSHPEFDARNVEADLIGPGVLLVRAIDGEEVEPGDDPVLGAFLAFIEADMLANQRSIQPLDSGLLARAERLVDGMEADLNVRVD